MSQTHNGDNSNSSSSDILLTRWRVIIRYAIRGAGCYAIGAGLTTLLAGDQGMSGAAFDQAVRLAQFFRASPSILWGVAAIVAGVLALIPQRRLSLCGLYVAVGWTILFGIGLALSAPPSGYRGVVTYAFIAMVFSGLTTLRMIDRRI